jgi:AI-2 transport protein TqsA
MSEPFPGVLVLAVGGSVAPPLLLLNILFLGSRRPIPNAVALALGYFSACSAIGISGLVLFGGAGSTVSTAGRVMSVTVGVLLLVLGLRSLLRPPDPDATSPMWMESINSMSPARAFGLGMALFPLQVKNLAIFVACLNLIVASSGPVDGKSGIGETITTALRQPSFLRVMLLLAATVVVFVGMRLAAPILDPILFAVVLALLFSPIYAWLRRHRIPTPLALLIMLVGLTILFVAIAGILGVSIARFSGDIATYTNKLNGQLDNIQSLTKSLGVSKADLHKALSPSVLTGAIGAVLSSIADFLSNLFLILVIVLFLLAEGPDMMSRLRASAGEDHPQVARLTIFGRNVVCQLGLRAIVNLCTGAGVTVLLLVLRVDFPLMWGILAFFLSFIPWIGLPLAVAPAVILALAEHGLSTALVVIAGVIVINILAENALSPMLMGRGLSISPTVLFLGFIFWAWLLGGPGAFLAAPLTIFLILMLDTFPETRWLANVMGMGGSEPDDSEEETVEPTQRPSVSS